MTNRKIFRLLEILNKNYLQVILVLRFQDKLGGTDFDRGKYLHTGKF